MSIFLISLPIFLIILSGWLLKKFKIITDDWIHILNGFTYYISLPALIVVSFWEINFLSGKSWQTIFWSLLAVIGFSLVVFIILSVLRINRKLKTAIFLSATAGNTIYMGFPLIELGLGKQYIPAGALVGVIYLIIPLLISIFMIKHWHNGEYNIPKQLYDFLKNPLVISAFIGVVLSFINLDIPLVDAFKKTIGMLGATASPVALFALGGFLYGRFLKKDLNLVFFISFLKIIIFPLIVAAGSSYLLKVDDFRILLLLSSMPVAVTTFVIAEKFNLDKDLVGNSIIVSTIISFIIAPLVIYLF